MIFSHSPAGCGWNIKQRTRKRCYFRKDGKIVMKKKLISVLLSVSMVAVMLAGCGNSASEAAPAAEAEAAEPAAETARAP